MALRKLKQKPVYSTIKNSKGEYPEIQLTDIEKAHVEDIQAEVNKKFRNALGYEVSITTLTQIVKKVSEQKYYKLAPADYVPIRVGEGTFSTNLTTFRSYVDADLFESGIINTGSSNTRLSTADADIDALNIKVYPWAKQTGWTIFDLEFAAKSGNWDLVAAKEKARKTNWDLGIQKIAFIGAQGFNSSTGTCLGLLNQPSVTTDTTTMTSGVGPLKGMTYAQIATFQQTVIQQYRANCNYTAMPTHFIIPESDYNGLVAQSSPQFPIKSTLQVLEEGFKVITQNPKFRILPSIYNTYANVPSNILPSAYSVQMYCLLNYDEESVRMDIPLDYTNTLANSIDNFMFQNAAYGQFTGVLAYRPPEMYYMGW